MLTRRRVVIAVNPTAGAGRRASVGKSLAQRLAAEGYEVRALEAPDATVLERAVRSAVEAGADALVVVGGDGMVHLGVGVVADTGIPLGIMPTGTGNDFARGLGLPAGDHDAAVDRLVEALARPARRVDAAVATIEGREEWFAGVLSAGFDARVNERANAMRRPRGSSRYVLALLRELIALRPIRYRLDLGDGGSGGGARDVDGVLLAVANNGSLGGGMRIAPDARVDDGLLDIVRVRPLPRLRFLRLFPRVFAGTHIGLREVEISRSARIRIEADDVVAYADGERLGALPVEIRVVPGALTVLV